MSHSLQYDATIFSVPVRWAIRVLAWLAFFVASYLAWTVATGSSVAGCDVGSATGCDLVLTSSWSKWLGVPVSLAGLACYAALAGLSVLIGMTSPHNSRWIDTLIVMLATIAAGASLWFIGVQLLAIGHFCPYCILVDVCGIALGGLALWAAFGPVSSAGPSRAANAGALALGSTIPGVAGVAPLRITPSPARPMIGLAIVGAVAILAALIGGQLLRPAKTYQVATVALANPIDMTNDSTDEAATPVDSTPTAAAHTALRVPTESAPDDTNDDGKSKPAAGRTDNAKVQDKTPPDSEKPPTQDSTSPTSNRSSETPRPKRLVKFLGGKLTLDTYSHPILGDPDAPHVMVELISYDCSHCRKMHKIVQRGLRRYGNQLAVLIVVMPMEMKCNRLITDPKASHLGACTTARMALGVAQIKPSAFRQFHDFLMADEKKTPSQQQAVGKAYRIVDSRRLRELTRHDTLNKRIARNIDLYDTLQKQHPANSKKTFGLPVQILGDEVMTGSVEDADDVYKAWEKNLGIKPL